MDEREVRFPFTSLILAAMKMGITEQRAMTMSYSRLLFYLEVEKDMHAKDSESKNGDIVRDATQEDINMLLL